jgi:hypothetical protein
MAASGDISAKLAKIMGWESLLYDDGELRENWDSIELESSVGAGEMVLTPKAGKDLALSIGISGAESFKAIRKGGDDSNETRLTFKIKTAVENAEAVLGAFWRANQNAECKMRITYAVQAKLFEPEQPDDDRQMKLPEE